MSTTKIDRLIQEMESYLECWKQFNHYIGVARGKKFGPEDEDQFLEIKSIMTQELEMLLASFESSALSKEEVHALIASAPSLRSMSEMNEGTLRGIENQWHKIFIAWQSVLGQLKVQQRQNQSRSFWSRLTGGK